MSKPSSEMCPAPNGPPFRVLRNRRMAMVSALVNTPSSRLMPGQTLQQV